MQPLSGAVSVAATVSVRVARHPLFMRQSRAKMLLLACAEG